MAWWLISLLGGCVATPSAVADAAPPPAPFAPWTVAVWMAGDNDLERYVLHDLDELERAAVAQGYHVVVQADRIPGYAEGGGDWTGTRRYAIRGDVGDGVVSPVVARMGERDMGDPDELADFLLWTAAAAPSEHLALVLWNHGGGAWIAQDDTDGGRIGVGRDLPGALEPVVAARGAPVDIVAFDACNMGEWEAAHALADVADVMVASGAWVSGRGLAYDAALRSAPPGADARTLGERLAWSAGQVNRELTMAAVDLTRIREVSDAVDVLAGAWLDHPERRGEWWQARAATPTLDTVWRNWWRDLGGFADASTRSQEPAIAEAGAALRVAVDEAVIASYGRQNGSSGLTIFTDLSDPGSLATYGLGPWSVDTRWDELLGTLAAP